MPSEKRTVGGPTLRERQNAGNQAQRRKAKFAALEETEGPRAGLTRATGAHGGSPQTEEEKKLEQVAVQARRRRAIE